MRCAGGEPATANRECAHVRYAHVDPHPAPPLSPVSTAMPAPATGATGVAGARRPPRTALADRAARHRRACSRRLAGVTVGAATGTAAAASTASTLARSGDYARAIAIDEAIATRTGPLYVLDPGAAASAAERRGADPDGLGGGARPQGQGRSGASPCTDRSPPRRFGSRRSTPLRRSSSRPSATDAAEAAVPERDPRLEEIARLAPATPGGNQAARQLPIDQAGEAGLLVTAGRATDAVAILDSVVRERSAQATRTADSLFPVGPARRRRGGRRPRLLQRGGRRRCSSW